MAESKFNEGFIYVANYSYQFRKLIKSLAERAESTLPSGSLKDIGVFLFGSPSRQEMIDESDADIMIIRKEDSQDYETFRSNFIKYLQNENFSKIDVPDWGNFEDCEKYIKESITEGNQVVEAKFVYGDPSTVEFLESLKDKYCTVDRIEKVFCFQKLYFDQYYKQRTLAKIRNVKYGHGGTRDFMFITWLINLLDLLEGKKLNFEDNFPIVYKSLSQLYEYRIIGFLDYKSYLSSIDVVLILRNEILKQNKWTEEEGLTYLDDNTVNKLIKRKVFKELSNPVELKKYLEDQIDNVARLKEVSWQNFLTVLSKLKGNDWYSKFDNLLSGNISRLNFSEIEDKDVLSQMAIIWNVDKNKDPSLFEEIFNKYKQSDSWCILASLACHSQCSDEVLDYIASKASKKGYEYILRIISRNKNTSKETLKMIMTSSNLEERYKVVARIAYNRGVDKANELR